MTLPRYLQAALAVTAAVTLWSLFSPADDAPVAEDLLPQGQPAALAAASASRAAAAPALSDNHHDLFPFQGPQVRAAPPPPPPPPTPPVAEAPRAPTLPFRVAGAWWSQQQRYLLLTDGRQSWIVCRQCKFADSIRSGEKLNDNWQLRAIEPDYLVFRWLPLENDQRLSLGDMKSKPEF
ncbi:hypothetical protein [Pantoea sp. B65]|uniref:hypothetical protein n=1 Tax=Pantoea sp. B65 TaxID=2813359 RepID=UPI0039B6AF23